MQKFADGQDTDVGSSPPWLWSRCVAARHAGPVLDCELAGWPPAGELARGLDGASDPLHPVAAPISRMDTQANASRSRPVVWGFQRPITASVYSGLTGILWLRWRPKAFVIMLLFMITKEKHPICMLFFRDLINQ
jgi:hypothetical protein